MQSDRVNRLVQHLQAPVVGASAAGSIRPDPTAANGGTIGVKSPDDGAFNAFAVASWRRGVVAPAQPAAARSLLCLLRSIAAFYLVLVRCRCPAF